MANQQQPEPSTNAAGAATEQAEQPAGADKQQRLSTALGITSESGATARIDRWLWAARLYKTRSKASKACQAGHVKCNGASAKAAKLIRPGDRIEAQTPGGPRIVEVRALCDKRGPAAVARTLYDDHTPPPPPREERDLFGLRERGTGRPSKRERRQLDKLLGSS